ncbi:MAG: hypothetical protein KatS3mg013_1444 [Actinomycetota bacterium]|jgi:cell wall-associated NlpC family hydrolase|nr:MAG: hypothetical protein KatS3mg013_1444 [Actinomycetota bacterium]
MNRTRRGTRGLVGALVAASLALPLTLVAVPSSAAPTKQEVEAAKARLEQLGHELERVIERFNDARYQLQLARATLAETERALKEAEAEAALARQRLQERAAAAYTGMGAEVGVLLAADDLTEFSDRLEFLGQIAQSDADLAAAADAAGQRAEWARERHAEAVAEAQAHLAAMADRRAEIQQMLDEQEALARTLQAEYDEWQDYLAAQRAAEAASSTTTSPPPSGGGGGGFVPPPNASAAQIAIAAARSVLGTRYVWGAADPNVGFDCSGLTSWAWAQAGVVLPHSASAQYGSLPRVPLSAVQPGDIIYYGNFGPHVALYIGGGQIIHARHPGPGGEVQVDSMYGYDEPWGAVRPG